MALILATYCYFFFLLLTTYLLQVEVAQRLGSSARAADEVVGHAWLEAMDMDGLVNLVVQVSGDCTQIT